MEVSTAQLGALVAIADLGSFEAAARELHVTPSAVSQRIRALESAAGQVLVRRGTPCTVTEAGARLLRAARQTRLLLQEVAYDDPGAAVPLPVAVNADTLATWFRDVLSESATWEEPRVALTLRVEDQGYSADLLRRGETLAAVTSDAEPVQGCRSERLGVMRYLPAAAPDLAERWRSGRSFDWAAMPVVVFDGKDDLQQRVLDARGVDRAAVEHRVPTSADFHAAIRRGLGWGMLPEAQLLPDLAAGRLVALHRREHIDVALHWQCWRLDSPVLARLTDAVRRSAAVHLRHPRR